ncbi:MAG: SCP2 sterol-binding domain-containing protein [Thermaerobacter sp.]|nr:SCP2 sterol-binding domain-containing protein [Thermaerobacter sp.]
MNGRELVDSVLQRANEHPEKLEGFNSDYVVDLTGEGGGKFRLRIADRKVAIVDDEGTPPKAAVTLAASDFGALIQERVSAMALFMQGKIRLQGDMGEAFRLESLFRS